MTLGAFLLVIFILWLIDKHNLWRKAAKISAVLFVLAILVALGIWIHQVRAEKRDEAEQRAAQQALEDASRTQLTDCITRMTSPPGPGTTLHIDAKSTCEENPNVTPSSDGPKWYTMQASNGKWYKTLAVSSEDAQARIEKSSARPERASTQLRPLLARSDIDLTTTELGSLICAHVTKGETVRLLQEDSMWVKVKTQSGKVGWAIGAAFEMTD